MGKKRNIDGLIFWQNSRNPVLGEILGIFPITRTFLSKNEHKLALSDSLASCKISKKVYESFLRKTDNWSPDIFTDLLT